MTDSTNQSTPVVTPKKTQEDKRKREYEANKQALAELCELYPDVFSLSEPKPLEIGIHETIAKDGKLSKTRIRRALNLYVRMRRYIATLQTDAVRITAGGEAAGKVTEDEAKHATERLAEIDKKRAQRSPKKGKPVPRAKKTQNNNEQKRSPKPTKSATKPVKAKEPEDTRSAEERLQDKLSALVNQHKK